MDNVPTVVNIPTTIDDARAKALREAVNLIVAVIDTLTEKEPSQ